MAGECGHCFGLISHVDFDDQRLRPREGLRGFCIHRERAGLADVNGAEQVGGFSLMLNPVQRAVMCGTFTMRGNGENQSCGGNRWHTGEGAATAARGGERGGPLAYSL